MTQDPAPAPRPLRSGLLSGLLRGALVAGWCVLGLVTVTALALRSGRPARLLEELLEARTNSPWEVELGAVRLASAPLGLALEGVALRGAGIELEVPAARLALGLAAGASPAWVRLELEGGRLSMNELPEVRPPGAGLGDGDSPTLLVTVTGLDLERGGTTLGRLDGTAHRDGDSWRSWARLTPDDLATQPIVVHARSQGRGLEAEVECGGVDLGSLAGWKLLDPALRARLEPLEPQGALRVAARLAPGEIGTAVDLGIALEGGRLELAPDLAWTQGSAFLRARGPLEDLVDASGLALLEGWRIALDARGQVGDVPLEVEALGGASATDPAHALEAWVTLPRADWEADLERLAGELEDFRKYDSMLEPSGLARLDAWIAVPRTALESPPLDPGRLPHEVVVRPLEDVAITYRGEPNERSGGARDLGFPLRVEQARGTLCLGFVPATALPRRAGLVGLEAMRADGSRFEVAGSIAGTAEPSEEGEFLLQVLGRRLPVDEDLRAALAGLSGVRSVAEVEPEYRPRGGSLDVALVLQREARLRALNTTLAIELEGVSGTWGPAQLSASELSGRITVDSRPVSREAGDALVRVALEGTARPAAEQVTIDGVAFTQAAITASNPPEEDASEPPAGEGAELGRATEQTSLWFRIDLAGLDPLDPRAVEAIVGSTEAGAEASEPPVRLEGSAPLARVHAFRSGPASPGLLTATAATRPDGPLAADLDGALPAAPRLHATLRLEAPLDEGVPTWRLAAADRRPGQPLASATSGPEGGWPLRVELAGLDASAPGLLEGFYGPSEQLPRLTGAADLALELAPGAPPEGAELDLDLSRIRVPGLAESIGPLRGGLRLEADGQLASERLDLGFAATRGELTDLELVRTGEGLVLSTTVRTDELPLDQRHLELLLGSETGRTLARDLGAAGTLELPAARLEVVLPDEGGPRISLSGDLSLRDARMELGVPVEVERLEAADVLLVNQGGRTRARARVRSLDGALAGRRLRDARFGLTFVEPRLTIEELSGAFEGGRLTSLGLEDTGTASFFSMDLAAPFGFSLAARMEGVDVGELTRGAFQSEFANQGTLRGDLRMAGELDDPVGIRGTGRVELRESALWAIPVFQALFAALGFDNTGVFSNMEAWLRLEDGRIAMSGMRLKSALLSLVGEGTLDLEGALDYGLEVRYSLVDKLGLLNQLIYRLQDELIRVSIEGDMQRPVIRAEGLLSGLFGEPGEGPRLPLPPLSPLPRVGR